MTDFGDTIRKSRLGQKIGLRELARRVEMSPQYLSNIENDRVPAPSAELVEKLALELGEDKEELLLLARRIDADLIEHAKKVAPKIENVSKIIRFFDSALKLGEDNPIGGVEGVVELAIGESLYRGSGVLKGAAFVKFMSDTLKEISEQEDGSIPEEIQRKRALGRMILQLIQNLAGTESDLDEVLASSKETISELMKEIPTQDTGNEDGNDYE